MSGNDQPPTPPASSGSEPEEPTPVEPAPADAPEAAAPEADAPEADAPEADAPEAAEPEVAAPQAAADDVVIAPPAPGATDAAASAKNKNVIIAAAVAAAIIVIGGIVAAVVLLGGDDDDDNKKDEAEVVSTEDFCQGMADVYAIDSATATPGDISDGLRDAGVTEELTDDQVAGRDLVIEIGDTAKDNKEAEKNYNALTGDEKAQADGFFTYVQTNCATQIQAKINETK